MNHWGMLGVAVIVLVVATLFFAHDDLVRIGETPEERWERIVEGARAEKKEQRRNDQSLEEQKAVARARKNQPQWYKDAKRGKRSAEQHPCLPLNPDSRSRFEKGWWKALDAKDDPDCTNRILLAFQMRNLILGAGYRCDSISHFRSMFFSYGFVVSCNRFRYGYEIEDKGGRWIVTVD